MVPRMPQPFVSPHPALRRPQKILDPLRAAWRGLWVHDAGTCSAISCVPLATPARLGASGRQGPCHHRLGVPAVPGPGEAGE